MSLADIVFWISLFCLAAVLIIRFIRRKQSQTALIIGFLVLIASGFLYYLYFQQREVIQSKGEQTQEAAFVVVLFVCMILGMLFQYLYNLFVLPKKDRPPFDWGNFLAPLFASPIVAIPMLVAFQNAEVDLTRLTLPKFMMFLVAIQNGFFWKEIFESRRKKVEDDPGKLA